MQMTMSFVTTAAGIAQLPVLLLPMLLVTEWSWMGAGTFSRYRSACALPALIVCPVVNVSEVKPLVQFEPQFAGVVAGVPAAGA